MRTIFLLLALICVIAVGCRKTTAPQEPSVVSSEAISLKEADMLMAQPAEEKQQTVLTETTQMDVSITTEIAAPEAGAQAPEFPDEKAIQKALKNLGLYQGEVDGKIGPKTKEAIREFQSKNNLSVDGKVGPKTWEFLKKGLMDAPAPDAIAAEAVTN